MRRRVSAERRKPSVSSQNGESGDYRIVGRQAVCCLSITELSAIPTLHSDS